LVCVRIPATVCARCKGYKRLCGADTCPYLSRYRTLRVVNELTTLSVDGSTPPSILVGEKGYPRVSLFVAVPPQVHGEEARRFEDPRGWWGRLGLEDIVELRKNMVSGFVRVHVSDVDRVLYRMELGFVAVSTSPVDTEIELSKHPYPVMRALSKPLPLTPSAPAKSIKPSSNPRVDPAIDRVLNDDLDAFTAITYLYDRGVDVYTIQRALSVGLLGRRNRRKLVPTRWAITAVDRAVSRHLLSRVWGCDTVNTSALFFVEYLGNRFWIYITPGKYAIHWIEIWHPAAAYTATASSPVIVYNRERVSGSVDYLDGGFEAAKIGVLEFLSSLKRQAQVYILREVLPSYTIPVGNWHIRESVRQALQRGAIARNVTKSEVVEIIREVSTLASDVFKDYLRSYEKVRTLDFFLRK